MKRKNLRSGHPKAPVRSAPTPARRSPSKSPPTLNIPAILFEGDQPGEPILAGAGQKFAVGQGELARQETREKSQKGELPEAYGTGKVLLLAREPHGLYSHWDLTREQQRRYNARSIHHHLVLRVHAEGGAGQPVVEQHVHADSRSWFVHVTGAATKYVAELGYYRAEDKWVGIGTSAAVATPADTVSQDRTVQYAAMAPRMPSADEFVSGAQGGARPATSALVQGDLFRGSEGEREVPDELSGGVQATARPVAREWAPAQERAIAEESGLHEVPQEQAGSMDIAELVRGQLGRESPSASVSSAWGGEQERPKEFWLNVNAELIIYGGTEPSARVIFGGRPLTLRPDGTFSCRVTLPDGEYEAVIEAVSMEGEERRVMLRVLRCTEYEGQRMMNDK